MAAEAIVIDVAEEILSQLIPLVTEQIGLAWGFKDDLTRLRDSVKMIQAVLADAEKRQVGDESVRLWLQRLKDVAYDADDVLGELAYEDHRQKVESQNQMKCMDNISHVRRLLIQHDGEMVQKIPLSDDHVRRVRTLVSEYAMFGNILSDFKCLRVLKLSGVRKLPGVTHYYGYRITTLPDSIGCLVHLRLLHISKTKIEALPNSITKLYNLQTLRIEGCGDLKELPKDLKKLDNLRHIYIDYYEEINRTPKDMGNLNCLRTLSFFIVGQDAGEQIKELGCLNQLSGELDITHLENVRDQEEARSANLAIKAKMNKLRFHWSRPDREVNHCNEEEVLEGLHPHQNLKSITIKGFGGKKFPSWMSLLDNLIEINLDGCNKCEQVPTLGDLPCLKALQIGGMDDVTCIGVEFYGSGNVLFPSLRTLAILGMNNLVEWKDALEEVTSARVVFPCLEELIIQRCPEMRSAPCHFPFLQKLNFWRVDSTALERISSNLTTLKSAQICEVSGLTFVPEQLFCTSLQSLVIEDCGELSYIPDTSQPLISLEELTIQGCPKLKCFPHIQGLQGLRRLSISGCGFEVLTTQLQLCTSLSQLGIVNCPNLKSLPDLQEFHSLARLYIDSCHNLKSIPALGELCFLRYLRVRNCSNITRLPEGSLKCLKSMEIGGYCEELDVFPSLNFIQHSHTTLEGLWLYGWAKLNSLPGEIQHFTALETLSIKGFDGIETLPEWLGNLSSLKKLYIWRCNNLMYLPTTRLIKLEELDIRDCSKLKERCAKGSGEEWFKIAHIPKIDTQSSSW